MKAIETCNQKEENKLLQDCLTPEMQEKKGRLVQVTGSDPLLRAQDVSEYGRQSLACRHLDGSWYEVSYRWDESDTVGIKIPVRIKTDARGKTRICYVTPYWGGSSYGDSLLDIAEQTVDDGKDAETFVATFFKTYAYNYVKMQPTLEQELGLLRQTYCTADMQGKYNALSQQYMDDGSPVDPLIGCADFDAFWYSSLRVKPLGKNWFELSYNADANGWSIHVKVMVSEQNGKYRISDLE
ncbi:MAG: hypothetical protein ACI3ZB_09205 [Prevotella sp.]